MVTEVGSAAGRRPGPRKAGPGILVLLLALVSSLLGRGLAAQDPGRRIAPVNGEERRVALVIGNDAYRYLPQLANAINDARAMKSVLGELDFDVRLVENATFPEIGRAVKIFTEQLRPGDVGLFYYSGHGIQLAGENFLVPVDFRAQDELDARYASYPANEVLDYMTRSRALLNVVILDACRDNPFVSSRSGRQGLATMSAGRGTLIAFATGPGKIASDNPNGANGLFTTYLIEKLKAPGLSLDQIFNQVARQVDAASRGRQTPWVVKSLTGDYYFRPPAADGAGGILERAFWESVKDSNDPEELRAYLSAYPNGEFAKLARFRLRDFPQSGSGEASPAPECGSAGECTRRGFELQQQGGVSDHRRAAGYYEQGCGQGSARACTNLGVMFENGQGVYKDPVKAAELYLKGCEGQDPIGCTWLGLLYQRGSGVLESPVKACELFRRGCEGDHAVGCTHLGIHYETGEGIDRDLGRAGRYYSQGCQGRHGPGCRRLGLLYEKGLGLPADPSLAAELYRLACDGGDGPGCSFLALLYSRGLGVREDRAMAASLYRRGCDLGDGTGCANLDALCGETRYTSCR